MRLQSKAAGEASTGRRETQRAREDQSMKSHSLLQLTPKTKYFSCVLLTLPRGHKRGKSTQLSFAPVFFPFYYFLQFFLPSFSFLPCSSSSTPFFFLLPQSSSLTSFAFSFPSSSLFPSFSQSWCGKESRAW